MQHLSDFKPLSRVVLRGLGTLDCSGLVLIVGPNSSGKSQLLRDIHYRISGQPRALVVAESVDVGKPDDLEGLLTCLEREGYLAKVIDEQGTEQLRPMTTYIGTGAAAAQINTTQPQQWWDGYSVEAFNKGRSHDAFLSYFGRLLVTALFLENRLQSVSQTGTFDFQTQPPQNDLQTLYVDETAKKELLTEVQTVFSRLVWPDASRGNILCLKVSDHADRPSEGERLQPRLMVQYRTIETEGDGLKSYVATCIALLLGRRPICLVDEPELCLHPPQAYSLGRFIGKFGAFSERATLVATHSRHILRGVIQSGAELQVVRMTRRGGAFEGHLVPSGALKDTLRKPTLRAETVLDGMFAQGVVVLEADGDRTVYQAVFETLIEEFHIDLHFAAVGGVGGIADTCQLYRTLNIPVAVIADLDVLTDVDKLQRIVSALGEGAEATRLSGLAAEVSTQLKSRPPSVTAEEVKAGLANVGAVDMDWSKGADGQVRSMLQELALRLDRMKRIKRGGIAALPAPVSGSAAQLVAELATIGFFVVPVGELEEWLSAYGLSTSKRKKSAWANEAAAKVRTLGARGDDIWAFMREVARHIAQAL